MIHLHLTFKPNECLEIFQQVCPNTWEATLKYKLSKIKKIIAKKKTNSTVGVFRELISAKKTPIEKILISATYGYSRLQNLSDEINAIQNDIEHFQTQLFELVPNENEPVYELQKFYREKIRESEEKKAKLIAGLEVKAEIFTADKRRQNASLK